MLLHLLASDEPIRSEDVAAIWAWIFGSMAFVAVVVSLLTYRYYRHAQKLQERKLTMQEKAEERKFIHRQLDL